ncbi:hypothetical protein [Ferrovum myxofaciens]|nr:hypothetical protein [Ferrovum myxofaciens]
MRALLECAFQPIAHKSGNVHAYEALMSGSEGMGVHSSDSLL